MPLALDTFALAAALGMAGLESRDRLRVTLVFTAFEAGMPIAGMLIGSVAGAFLGAWAGYGGIAFLFVAGLLLLRPGKEESDETGRLRLLAHARGLAILDLGLSISVDELTVGLSAGLLGLSIVGSPCRRSSRLRSGSDLAAGWAKKCASGRNGWPE